MNVGLYRSAVAMAAQEGRLNVLAGNLANVGTPGFKRELSTAQENQMMRRLGPVRGIQNESKVDFSQGSLQRTDRDLDMALLGSGFYELEGENGPTYTREGNFFVTPEGHLVTTDGAPLVWEEQGQAIDPTGEDLLVDEAGEIKQGTTRIGRLRITDFEDYSLLARTSDGRWSVPAGAKEITATASVHQGALEASNANPIEELVQMIALQRSYETTATAFNGIGETFQRLTRPF